MTNSEARFIAQLHAVKSHIVGYDNATHEVIIACTGGFLGNLPCMTPDVPKRVKADPYALMCWLRGALVTRAFPDLSADDRELLISGTCPSCYKRLYKS